MKDVLKGLKRRDYIYALLFLPCLAMIFYKCSFGFGHSDEAFYLTIPYRLCQGDGLFVNEYHLSQMSGFLIYPIMKIYFMFTDSTEGLILNFRYIFTAMHALTALFLYCKLRFKGSVSIAISLVYLLFTPFGIMALSYNSMGIAMLAIATVLVYTNNGKTIPAIGAGICFALAVLCCPYLVLLYLYYLTVSVAMFFRAKNNAEVKPFKTFILFTAGCAVVCVAFFAFVFSRCSLGQFSEALSSMLNDPEHPRRSVFVIIRQYVYSVLYSNSVALPVLAATVVIAVGAWFKKMKKYAAVFLLLGILLMVVYYIPFFDLKSGSINFLMFPPVVLGIISFSLFPKENKKEFLCLYVPGLIYGVCVCASSNQAFYVISGASLISLIGSFLMFANAVKKADIMFKVSDKTLKYVGAGVMAAVVIFAFAVRYNTMIDKNKTISQMTAKIETGVCAGIYATEADESMHEAIYEEVSSVREYDGKKVLYFSQLTYLYLEDKKANSAYSAWLCGDTAENPTIGDYASESLLTYYARNPNKVPDVIYCSRADYKSEYRLFKFFDENGYKMTETEKSYFWIKQ